MPVVEGRAIEGQDIRTSKKVVVVNQQMAATYFKGDHPLGHIVRMGRGAQATDFEIVGIVKDVRYSQIRTAAPPILYFSYLQFQSIPNAMTFEVRATIDPTSIVDSIRRESLALSYTVPRRTREIGIRMALGARSANVLAAVLRETSMILLAGLAIGLPVSLVTTNFLKDQLFGLTPHDATTTSVALVLISVITLLAGYLPAQRASNVSPSIALRTD